MKKIVSSVLILIIMLLACACGQTTAPAETSPTPTSDYTESADDEGPEEFSMIQIGFSFSGQGSFYDQLEIDIKNECEELNYNPQILVADSAEQQQKDIRTLLATGVAVIVIDPVDVDALESVLNEAETQSVPVVNIINSINGTVSTLVSPDYISIGKSAGQRATGLYGEAGGACMMLKTGYDSFTMQLMSDGFNKAIAEDEDVTLVSEQFGGNDEEKAYEQTKSELSANKDIKFIFAQSTVLAQGAMRAIKEQQSTVSLVVFGGDMDIIDAVVSGDVDTAIFFGPAELAEQAVFFADRFIQNDTYVPPQYRELTVDVVQAETAADYAIEGQLHAEVKGQ